MDALDRIEPIVRGLLARVDAALIAHGAPAGHPLWEQLRRLGATPGDVVAFFATTGPAPLGRAAESLRARVAVLADVRLHADAAWQGAAGEAFAAHASAMQDHLGTGAGEGSICGRWLATASYVDEIAGWFAGARMALARTLAEVLSSAQAVAVASCPEFTGDVAEGAQFAATAIPRRALAAAADIGAHVLAAAATLLAEGDDLRSRWEGRLSEVTFRAPAATPTRLEQTLRLRH
jgi:hypothetical protein